MAWGPCIKHKDLWSEQSLNFSSIEDTETKPQMALFLKNKFIYLFLAALGLHCCTWALSSCAERGLLFVALRGLLIAVASLVAEHGL